MIGKTLAHYEITGLLGKGGMGEVYQATDTRLGRSVAIKILATHLGQDESLRQRMEREAKVISSLNHKNICTLYDVGREDGVDFLAMEYLEGETLSERLAHGPMSLEELLRVAMEVTDALHVAHKSGVIHRDLKPGNIMLTPGGTKLLDFGLAKNMGHDVPTDLTASPTLASPLTTQGSLVGTFHYMAPELLEGAEASARSDLFALGTVLYEMATGQKAFDGKTQAGLIAAVLEREPPELTSLQPGVPPALENLVSACLTKDPEQRIQNGHDVLLQLRWIAEGKGAALTSPTAVGGSPRVAWALVAVLALACGVLAWQWLSVEESPPPSPLHADLILPPGLEPTLWGGGHLALSPDGQKLVFAGADQGDEPQLWLRWLDRDEVEPLAGTEDAYAPFWSPDSRHVGFFASGFLRRVQIAGGGSLPICPAGAGRGGTWNEDGVILFAPQSTGALARVAAGGGDPMAVTTIDTTNTGSHRWPVFLPDNNRFLYVAQVENGLAVIRLASLDGNEIDLMRADSSVAYADGHLLFARENTLLAQALDWKNGELAAEPWPVAEPVIRSGNYARAGFSVSTTGRLVYQSTAGTFTSALATYDRDGKVLGSFDAPSPLDDFDLSDDGTKVAVSRPGSEGGQDVWTYDIARSVFSRVSLSESSDDPAWSPDGLRIAYADDGNLHVKLASGAGADEPVFESNVDKVTSDWSADGTLLFFTAVGANQEDVWFLDLATKEASPILESEFREMHAQLSPDGKWMAYTSTESGRPEVYVLSFPALDQKWPISRDGGSMPRWRADGGEIFFMSPQKAILAATINHEDDTLNVGDLVPLFPTRLETSYRNRTHQFDVAPAGDWFMVIESPVAHADEQPTISVITDWPGINPEPGS